MDLLRLDLLRRNLCRLELCHTSSALTSGASTSGVCASIFSALIFSASTFNALTFGASTFGTKEALSLTRSPTTAFSINEILNVFRVANDAIDRVDRQIDTSGDSSSSHRPLVCLFTTDGELSTFSDD